MCSAGSRAPRRLRRSALGGPERGELGSTDEQRWPAGPTLAEVRTRELAACLTELGVTEHIWLDYPDGGCADIDEAAAIARLRDIAERVQPDTVLTFGPDGATWHPDHMAVSRWTTSAMRGTGAAQSVPGVPAGKHSGDDGGPGALAALDLAGGAAHECRGPDVLHG